MLKKLTAFTATIIFMGLNGLTFAAQPDSRPVDPAHPVAKVEICHCEMDEETEQCAWETITVPDHAVAHPHMAKHGDYEGTCPVVEAEPSV